jgi:hypothetical protein
MLPNGFRLAGDSLHALAILALISKIIETRSCYLVSGKTTILYAMVFSCRYLDLYPFRTDFLTFLRSTT